MFGKTQLSGIVWEAWNDRAGRDPRDIQPIIQETEAQREEGTWPKALRGHGDKDHDPLLTFSILIPGPGGQEPQSLHVWGRPREGQAG